MDESAIEPTIELHKHFMRYCAGNATVAALLSLTHTLRQQPAPAERKPGRYLNAEQAADYLGCSTKSLYRQVELGRLVPLRGPKRSYRFTAAMLDRYLAA